MPASDKTFLRIQNNDKVCQLVKKYLQDGWPDEGTLKGKVKSYFQVMTELSIK